MNFEWVNKGIEPLIHSSQFQNLSLKKANLEKFHQVLTRSGIVVGNIKDLSRGEQQFFKKMKALSTAVVPIFVEENGGDFSALMPAINLEAGLLQKLMHYVSPPTPFQQH